MFAPRWHVYGYSSTVTFYLCVIKLSAIGPTWLGYLHTRNNAKPALLMILRSSQWNVSPTDYL